jgi:ABC-2 type transport system ATP-binding protein
MMPDEAVPAIEVRGLTKDFGELRAVAGVDFDVRKGEIFGFLGPNGAGKTTTINILAGLARPTTGTVRIMGLATGADNRRMQRLLGVVPDENNLYPELDGAGNLEFCGALYGMSAADRRRRASELLDLVGLRPAARRKFATYSRGMKRRLTIAAALMHRPSILFLDEPTTGIDVASSRELRQVIADLNRAGTTVFLTTHNTAEAEQLCQRIAFIVEGRLVRVDTVARLTEEQQGEYIIHFALDAPADTVMSELCALFPGLSCEWIPPTGVRLRSAMPLDIAPYVRFFEERGIGVREARRIRSSLEDVFVRVTQVGLHAMQPGREDVADAT